MTPEQFVASVQAAFTLNRSDIERGVIPAPKGWLPIEGAPRDGRTVLVKETEYPYRVVLAKSDGHSWANLEGGILLPLRPSHWRKSTDEDDVDPDEILIQRAARWMANLDHYGALHIVIDDGNVLDEHLDSCRLYEELRPEEAAFLRLFSRMTEEERDEAYELQVVF